MRSLLSAIILIFISGQAQALRLEERTTWSGMTYTLGIPKQVRANSAVVLLLHGCKMTGDDVLKLSEISKHADDHGFLVVSPSQSVFANYDRCWNFFSPDNQMRGMAMSELAHLRNLTVSIQEEFGLKLDNAIVMGISSGGAQAMNLFACYPETFKGAAIHSGTPYAAAQSVYEANYMIENGPQVSRVELQRRFRTCAPERPQRKRTMVIVHGLLDKRVVPANGRMLLRQVHTGTLKSGHSLRGYPIEAKQYDSPSMKVLYMELPNLAHKWSGSQANSNWAEPEGPSATDIFIRYLQL